jgi:hypothetical protein
MTTRITTPGIYKMRAAEYHADPCLEPSLSSTIARVLCDSAPAHAQHAHPRLNLQNVEEEAEHFDIGTAAHAILLEGEAAVTVIDAKDWRTNAAKDARDAATRGRQASTTREDLGRRAGDGGGSPRAARRAS